MENWQIILLLVGIGILFIGGYIGLFIWQEKIIKGFYNTIENELKQKSFNISRKVAICYHNPAYVFFKQPTSFFLYVDDINRKWVITTPFLPKCINIRSYEDLIDYDFFDEDGLDIDGKIGRGLLGFMGAVAGGVLFGGVGAVAGGYGTAKASKILPNMQGESKAYGLIIKTNDCNVNNPTLIFDFRNIAFKRYKLKKIPNYVLGTNVEGLDLSSLFKATGEKRGAISYKKNITAIKKIAETFDYILTSNAQQQKI